MITNYLSGPQRSNILKFYQTFSALTAPDFNRVYIVRKCYLFPRNYVLCLQELPAVGGGTDFIVVFFSQHRAQITHQLYGGDGLAPL